MVEVIKLKVNKMEVNIKTCHVICHVTSILKILVRANSSWSRARRLRYYICLALAIIDSKVITRELLDPLDLFRAQALYIHKLTEVIMVRKDKNLVFAAF